MHRRDTSVSTLSSDASDCANWPTLSDVITEHASYPWTLPAFEAFLSRSYCLETLQFIMDCAIYTDLYFAQSETAATNSDIDSAKELMSAWQSIINTYITPEADREINISDEMKAFLLGQSYGCLPPSPSILQPAIHLIFEIMESLLPQFIASLEVRQYHCGRCMNERYEYSGSSPHLAKS